MAGHLDCSPWLILIEEKGRAAHRTGPPKKLGGAFARVVCPWSCGVDASEVAESERLCREEPSCVAKRAMLPDTTGGGGSACTHVHLSWCRSCRSQL